MQRLIMRLGSSAARRHMSLSAPRFAAPNAKLVEIYNRGFESETYPVNLLGGSHITFSKLLYKFAEEVDGKAFAAYATEFDKLDAIIAKEGPFWFEDMEGPSVSALKPGFKFVLAWMKDEGMIDAISRVKASYLELVGETTKQIRATITVPYDPATKKSEVAAIEKEVAAFYKGSYKIVFDYVVAPELQDGYTFEVDGQYINKSAAAAAAAAAASASSEKIIDWTAVPPVMGRSDCLNDELMKLLGPRFDAVLEASHAEAKYGV